MRLKLTLTLVVFNLVVFGLIIYLDRTTGDPGGDPTPSGILGTGVENVNRIEISGPALPEPRIIERMPDDRNWKVLSPTPWPANLFAISRILNQLQFLEEEVSFYVDELAQAGQSLADYGVDPPQLVLRVRMDGRTE